MKIMSITTPFKEFTFSHKYLQADVMFCRGHTLQGAIKAETSSGQVLYCSPVAQTYEVGENIPFSIPV